MAADVARGRRLGQMGQLRRLFDLCDADRDGKISRGDVTRACDSLRLNHLTSQLTSQLGLTESDTLSFADLLACTERHSDSLRSNSTTGANSDSGVRDLSPSRSTPVMSIASPKMWSTTWESADRWDDTDDYEGRISELELIVTRLRQKLGAGDSSDEESPSREAELPQLRQEPIAMRQEISSLRGEVSRLTTLNVSTGAQRDNAITKLREIQLRCAAPEVQVGEATRRSLHCRSPRVSQVSSPSLVEHLAGLTAPERRESPRVGRLLAEVTRLQQQISSARRGAERHAAVIAQYEENAESHRRLSELSDELITSLLALLQPAMAASGAVRALVATHLGISNLTVTPNKLRELVGVLESERELLRRSLLEINADPPCSTEIKLTNEDANNAILAQELFTLREENAVLQLKLAESLSPAVLRSRLRGRSGSPQLAATQDNKSRS